MSERLICDFFFRSYHDKNIRKDIKNLHEKYFD